MLQRLIDIALSSFSLMILSPLFLFIMLILRFSGEGEIFFLQERIGKDGKKFKLFKFATMLKNSQNIGSKTITIKNDPRVLPLGKFLRKSKINEVPQLLNIFFGSMSVVGPRPLTEETFNLYADNVQKRVSVVRPGLSGIGSIIFRDEENILNLSEEDSTLFYQQNIAPYKGELEMWYVNHSNIFTYLQVIMTTIWIVIFPSSKIYRYFFKELPEIPDKLKIFLD